MKLRMNVHHVLFFGFLSGALCHRNTNIPTETYSGDFPLYTATEGQNISFEFPFTLAGGSMRYLCKGECKKEDILIKTHHDTAQRGRYSIRYHEGVLQVTITELKRSDSGWYRCGVSSQSLSDSYEELVEISVTEAQQTVTSTEVSEQRSTEERRSTAAGLTTFPTTTKQSEQQPTEETTATATDYSLVVCACATVVGVVPLAVFLLLLYKRKSKRETGGLNVRGNSDDTNTEFVTYENCPPVSSCEDSTYQSLDPVSKDQDQTYFTLHSHRMC